jgi:hypothetical protein
MKLRQLKLWSLSEQSVFGTLQPSIHLSPTIPRIALDPLLCAALKTCCVTQLTFSIDDIALMKLSRKVVVPRNAIHDSQRHGAVYDSKVNRQHSQKYWRA